MNEKTGIKEKVSTGVVNLKKALENTARRILCKL